MNTYKYVSFNTPDYLGTSFYVELTETDSETTFQHFLEDAFTSFQNYVADCMEVEAYDEHADEYGQLIDEIGYKEALDEYRNRCYVERIRDVSEDEVPEAPYTTDDGEYIEF